MLCDWCGYRGVPISRLIRIRGPEVNYFQIILGKIFKLPWISFSENNRCGFRLFNFQKALLVRSAITIKLVRLLYIVWIMLFSYMSTIRVNIPYMIIIVLLLAEAMITHFALHLCFVFFHMKD